MSDGGGAFIFLQIFQKRGVYYAENKIGIHRNYSHNRLTLYNIVLASGTFVNATFLTALKTMWMEFILIFLCAYFLSSHVAKYFAFQRNFIMALPLQLFLVGPLARKLFRMLFRRVNGPEEAKVERELLEEGIAE